MRLGRTITLFIACLAMVPLVIVLIGATIAAALGCEVTDLGPTTCRVLSYDVGGPLSLTVTAGWLSLITIPIAMLAAAAWSLIEVYAWRRRRRKERRMARG